MIKIVRVRTVKTGLRRFGVEVLEARYSVSGRVGVDGAEIASVEQRDVSLIALADAGTEIQETVLPGG